MILITFECLQKYEQEYENFQIYIDNFTEVVKIIISIAIEHNQVSGDLNIDDAVFMIKSNMYGLFFLWLVQEIDDIESSIAIQIDFIMKMLTND